MVIYTSLFTLFAYTYLNLLIYTYVSFILLHEFDKIDKIWEIWKLRRHFLLEVFYKKGCS